MYSTLIEKWPEILNTFKQDYDISDVSFKTWIKPLQVKSFEDNVVTLVYQGETEMLGLQYIKKKYQIPLKVTIEEIMKMELELQFVLPSDIKDEPSETEEHITINESASLTSRIAEANLNSKYTFDTFVVGSNNILAHDTSLAVAESPGGIYNPLFIYGGVGLGKTHLMPSIGHFVLNKNPNAKVLYTTSESFTNELIETLRNKSGNQQEMSDFRAKYRNVDVLLIDDIQFLQKKESTQEEFFHTFQYLYMHKKAIVISSDRKPKDLEGLEDRLVNRFESGLTVDIQSPNYETRMAILKKKVEVEGIDIPNDVLDYISTNVIFNIRELEGSLTKIIAFSKISNQTIDLDFAKDVLKDYISPEEDNTITCKKIIEVVADHFGISPNDLASKKRSKEIAYARQVCMYICKTLTDETNKKIGLALHKDNPSTVIYGVNQIKEEMARDINTKNMVEVIIKKLNTK